MALREIRKLEDEILRKKSRKVDKIDDRIVQLLDDMIETMHEARGVGLAAVQVGVLKRIIVLDVGHEKGILKIINPEIIKVDGSQTTSEACLSIPGVSEMVTRPYSLTVKGLNENGEEAIYEGNELFARAVCHEVDHLDGILFIDKVEKEE